MKKRKGDDWFPFWIDKWLFGSTRDELTVEQCAVWVDFLAISYKDEGYIRANVGFPYSIKRLSGMLNRSEKLIQQTIDRCLEEKIGKLRREKDGTLYVLSHPEYELSKRHKRRLNGNDVRQNGHSGQKSDARGEENRKREEEKKEEKIKKEALEKKKLEAILLKEFDEFWIFYRSIGNKRDDSGDKNEATKAYKTLRKTVDKKKIAQATNGYADFLKGKRIDDNFEQRKMYASSFLRSKKWQRFLDFKYEPSL